MNIRVDLNTPIKDGQEVVFRAPCSAGEVAGLTVYYPVDGVVESQTFAFADAHANDLADLDNLFDKDGVVKVILDLETGKAFVQNADTNAYIESKLFLQRGEGEGSIVRVIHDADTGNEYAQPTATGESSISLGRYCRVSGKNAMAVNYNNQVIAIYGFAANFQNQIGELANAAAAFGDTNKVYAPGAFVAGRLNQILEDAANGFVAGQQNILDVPDGARFGRFSKLTEALFAIGNGHGTQSRSNAFEVFEDGSMALDGETFTAEELRETITNVAALASKSAMMAPIIHTETGETVPLLKALQLQGVSVYGKTTQDGTPTPEAPVEISSIGDDGGVELHTAAGDEEAIVLRVPTPGGLPGILLTSTNLRFTTGNYVDANGRQWYTDERNLDRAVYIQRIATKVFDGTENWGYAASVNTFYTVMPDARNTKYVDAYCTHFDSSEGAYAHGKFSKSDVMYFCYEPANGDVEAWKAWLAEQYAAGTPVTVVYALNEAVETPLGDLYKSTDISFGGGDGANIPVGYETDNWILRYKRGRQVFHNGTYLQGNLFQTSNASCFVLEIKNDAPGIFDMVIGVEKSSSAADAEVYYFAQAPADGWTDDVIDSFTPDSSEYVGLLDGAAGIADLQYRKAVEGNFFLLFKATDLGTNAGGPFRLNSLSMEQVDLNICLENKPNCALTAEGAGVSVTYAADTKTYIDYKFTELQSAILSAGANV